MSAPRYVTLTGNLRIIGDEGSGPMSTTKVADENGYSHWVCLGAPKAVACRAKTALGQMWKIGNGPLFVVVRRAGELYFVLLSTILDEADKFTPEHFFEEWPEAKLEQP